MRVHTVNERICEVTKKFQGNWDAQDFLWIYNKRNLCDKYKCNYFELPVEFQ